MNHLIFTTKRFRFCFCSVFSFFVFVLTVQHVKVVRLRTLSITYYEAFFFIFFCHITHINQYSNRNSNRRIPSCYFIIITERRGMNEKKYDRSHLIKVPILRVVRVSKQKEVVYHHRTISSSLCTPLLITSSSCR